MAKNILEKMDTNTLLRMNACLSALQAGDKNAAHELVMLALSSVQTIAHVLLRRDFSRFKGHDTDSVLNTAWSQLVKQFKDYPPESIDELFKKAWVIIRNDLLEMARREGYRYVLPLDGLECASESPDAEELASRAELRDAVSRLPDVERTVLEFHYYLGMPQSEIALLLDMHPRAVSRRRMRAEHMLAVRMKANDFAD